MQNQEKTCFDAVLDRWVIQEFCGSQAPFKAADGFIYGDSQKRWPDGTPVSTSRIVRQFNDDAGNVYIKTRNTTYKLGQSYEDWLEEQEKEREKKNA